MIDFIQELNDPQREAATSIDGALMIIAGAGSGKTRVLTYRIAYLMTQGVEAYQIIALTFTNKAAKEMRNRIEKLVGNDAKNLWMGTFHSIFAKILRFEAEKIGFTSNFTIYDTQDSMSLIRDILKEMQLDDKVYKPNAVFSRISSCKNKLISCQEYQRNPMYFEEDKLSQKPEMGRIYKNYVDRCFKANAMDFDDLLFKTNVLFRDHADVLTKYQQKFKYVLVDEFQDTNISQYVITRRLAGFHKNICVVGDDAQSIYAFRGADIQNILNFEKDYPNLKVVKLEQNYRSTQTIVNVANKVISHNQKQLKKNVWTSNDKGHLIELIKTATDNDEGKQIANVIFEEKMQSSVANKDFAILYRTNSQSRAFEESLRRIGLKYKVIGGLSFYQRKEIKDLIAYLRFTVNQNDEEAFKRIINLPKRGIGDSTVLKIVAKAQEAGLSLWQVVKNATVLLGNTRIARPIKEFSDLIDAFIGIVEKKDAFETATYIAKHSGLLQELFDDKTIEGRARYENVQELLNAIKEFVVNPESENLDLSAFLQQVSLLTSADDDKDDDRITLMTIHAAKGLEFKYVYVVGLEEDLFPSQMMLASREDLEEERRLFYVAITRAEIKLTLSYALQRYRFGNLKPCEASRFLMEIDPVYIHTNYGLVAKEVRTFNNNVIGKSNPTPASMLVKPNLMRSPNTITRVVAASDFIASDPTKIEVGMAVTHPKFGDGVVLKKEVGGGELRIKVNFESEGEKTLLMNFAKLMIKR